MKKLNQNNTIATTAMLTKINTMKNKMNFFAKVVMLVVMILACEGTWNVVHADYWHFANDRWWALFIQENFNNKCTKSFFVCTEKEGTGNTHSFYLPTGKNSTTEFYAKSNKSAQYPYTATLTISGNGLQNATCYVTVPSGKDGTTPQFANPQCTVLSGHNTAYATFSKTSNTQDKSYILGIGLPDHVEVNSGVTKSYSTSVDMTSSTIPTGTISINFSTYFKSFYTQTGNVTLSIDGDDASCFSINNNDSTLINQGKVYASSECWGTEFQGNEKPGTRTITFTPNRVGRHEAILHINYGGSSICDITLTGTCNSAQQVIWTSTLPSPYIFNNGAFSSIDNLSSYLTVKDMFNKTVSSPGTITFTANNGATVSGNKLTFANCSTVTVTATSIGAKDNYLETKLNSTTTCQATRVTPVISSFAKLDKGYVGTSYNLSGKADWAASGQPERSKWINDDGVVINYTSSNTSIAAGGATFTPEKAGLVTITASIDAANNHNASTVNLQQPLQIDFDPNVIIHTFQNAVKVGSETTETINLADFFVPNGSYSATVTSGSEFSVINGTNITDNNITVKFTPTSISDVTASSEDKEATIQINDGGKSYSFRIQATAEKAEANLTVFYSGDTHVFSTITLSNSKSTTAGVTYKINGEAISGNTYKIPSVSPITISATTPANAGYMAGYAELEPFTPTPVTPVLSWNQSDFGDKKVGDADLTFNAATWTNTQGEPEVSKWDNDEVTIKYTPSNDAITVNGNTIHINKAGVATLKASIEAEKNHHASNTISKTINIAFADGKTITLNGSDGTGTFVGESSQLNVDLSTEMVKEGDLVPTSTNQYFSVTFNGYAMDITFSPAIYNNGNITETFTFLDNGTGKEYTLLLSGNTKKHTPVIAWKDDKTLALSTNPEMKSLNELLESCSYCDGATIKTSDANVVMVFKSDGTPAGEGEEGETFWAFGNGQATITLSIPETESHTSATSQETFTVSGVENTRVSWNQSLVFEYSETQKTEPLSAVAYRMNANEPTGQKITYEIVSQNPNGIVSLTQDAYGDFVSPLIINGTGTATIKAKAKATTSYAASESSVRTITINKPAQTGECTIKLDEVNTTGGKTYNFVLDGHDANDYYYVDKITYYYYVKGNAGQGWLGGDDGKSKTITATVNGLSSISPVSYTGPAGVSIGLYGFEPEPVEGNDEISINTPPSTQNAATGITFSGDIGTNSSAFTDIVVTPSKYLKATSTTSHTFGSPTAIFVGQSETAQLTIAEYAFLNGNQVDMKLVNLNDDGDYAGGEFTILDKSGDDDWGNPCDYGKIKVHVQFAPLSGKDDAVHKCRIKITGTIGTNSTSPVYFTLEGHAQRNQQEVVWEQDLDNWNSQTGEVILAALSNQSDAQGAMEYEIVSQTAATSGETTGVVTKDGSKLTIHKAGTVTIKAKHPGDDKYLPADKERTFTISRVTPTITLSSEAVAIDEEITAIYGDEAITIEGEAIYNSKAISGYSTGTNELIGLTPDATGVVSVTEKAINLLKAGTATVTAKVETDDVVNEATKTFNVKVNPATQSLIWDVIADVPAGQYGDNPVTINLEDNCKSHDDSHNIDIAGDLNKTFTITGWNCCNGKTGNEVAYIDGNILYITGAYTGTITITASQDGKNKNNNDSEDYTEASETTTVTIVPITPTITFEPKSTIHYLEEITLSAKSTTGNYSHNLTADDFALENGTGSASLTNGILKGTGVGKVKVTASQQNDCQVKDIQPVEKEITIIANDQTLEWDQTFANVKTLDNEADIELTAWSKDDYTKNPSNLAINYTLSNETSECGTLASIATKADGKKYLHITGVGPGTVTIHAFPESNANYNSVSEKTKTITIEKSTPTIQLSYTPTNGSKTVLSSQGTINATYGDQPYIIEGVAIYNNEEVEGYTAGANGKIVLTADESGVVSVTGNNTINILKQGTAVITASIAEDCLVKDVANFTLTVNVNRATPTLSWQTPPQDANFNDNGNTQTVVAQAAETDDTFSFTYAISDANPADVASINANTGVITINKAGTFKVTATNVMTDKYGATNIESELITISKCQTGTITINGNNTMRYGTSQTLTCTTTNTEAGQTPQYSYSSDPAGMVDAATGVVTANVTGTITITATLAATTSYEEISNTFGITVDKADQRVVWGNISSGKLKTTDLTGGILLTANAYNAHLTDNVATDGTIEFEIIDGSDYAEVKEINGQWRLVSKKNGVHNIQVKAKSSGTSNYYPGESSEIKTIEMEKDEPTIAWTTEPEATMTFVDKMSVAAVVTGNTDDNTVLYTIENSTGSATFENTTSGGYKIVPSKVGMIVVNAKSLETTNFKQVAINKLVTISNAEVEFTIADISMHYGDPELTITPTDGGLLGYVATYTIASSSDYQYISNNNGVIPNGKINVIKANPGQHITITPSFTLANYTISCDPFTVTIDKAEQSLTWNPETKEMSAALIGLDEEIDAPKIGFKYEGIENEITYTPSDNNYITVSSIPGNQDKIKIRMLKYSATPITISASYAGNENVKSASTSTPLSLSMKLQTQKVVWDVADTIVSDINTTNDTSSPLTTLKGHTTSLQGALTGNIAKCRAEFSNVCPTGVSLVTIEKVPLANNDTSYIIRYTGEGSGHVKIIAYGETDKGYEHTNPEYEKTIEFNVLPATATITWNTSEFADARYGDIITMTPTISPDKGNKVFTYTFEEDKNLTCQENVLSIKDVATEGTTITAWNTPDCFVAADVDGYTRSVTINKTPQEIVWGQEDMSLDVVDADDVQLTAYAIDSRHNDPSTTCLELSGGKYITAKTTGDKSVNASETDMAITYIVEEQDGVCKVVDNEPIVTVDGNGLLRVTGNGTGQVKITPTVSEGAHYTSKTGTPIIVTINKVTPTVTVTGPVGPLNYGTGPHTLTASSEIGSYSSETDPNAAFTYTITEGTDVASINGDQLTILKAGTVKVTATQTKNCIVNSATSADYVITIDEISPSLEFTAVPTVAIAYGDNTQSVKAESQSSPKSEGAVTYTSNNTAVATVDASTGVITPVAQGTFTVTANIAAVTGKWVAGQATSSQITINRADPQLAWNVEPTDATYDPANNTQSLSVTEISDAAPTFSVTPESPSTDGATIDAQSGVLTITKTGTYKVTVTLVETDKYNSASIEKTIVISKADADFFSIADITMTYNDEAISLNNDISGGTLTLGTDYQVSYSVGVNGTGYFNVDDANKTINPLKANVGENGDLVEMTLNASISGMTNYNDKLITGKVYVQRATQAIVWSGDIQTSYNTWNAGAKKTVNLDDFTQSQDASHNTDITPDLTKTYELVISNKGCDIDNANVAYIDNDNVLHITGAASATLTIYAKQNGTDGNGENYTKVEEANNCTTVITISKITPTISFERINVNGGADVYYSDKVTYTVSSTGNDYLVSDVSKFTFNVTSDDGGAISENKASHAGNVKIKASQAEDCMINGAESGEVDVEIKKAPQSVSWEVTDLGTLSATSTEGVELTAVAMNSRRITPSGMTITYTVCDAQGNDITSGALITIDDKKVYSANNGSGEAWVKAVANGNDNYEASETLVIKKITITNATPTIAWTDPCSEQMTMNYREEKQLTFSCNYTGYTASYSLTETSDDTYVDMTELANGNVKIIGVKPNNGTIGIKVTISDPKGNYSDGELTTAISTLKNNTEIDWNGQSFGKYTTANAGMEIELIAFVKDSYKGDNSGKPVAYDFKSTDVVENCGNIVELTDEGKLKITGNAAGTVTLYANYAGDENYNASTEKSMQITVGKQTPRFEWTDNTGIQATYGDVNVSAGKITKDGDGVVTYSSNDEDETVAKIDGKGNITIVGAGTITILATLAADCQYEAVTTAIEKTLTVNQATGTISWVTEKEPHNDTYSTTLTEEVEATSNNTDDGSIEYSSSNTDVADFENGVLKIYKAGTTTITATRAATRNFTEAKCSTEIVISKAACTISITSPATITYGQNATIEYSKTNTDQNVSVIFHSENTSIVSISGDQATGAGAGTTYVYAEIAESDNYLSAKSDDFNITVTQASKIFTIADMSLTYGDQNKPITITDSGITGYTVSYSIADADKSYIEFNQDGTINAIGAHCDAQGNLVNIPVTASFRHDNYTIADVTFNVTVAKATQTITWDTTYDETYTIFSKIMFNATTDAEASATNKVYYTWTQTPTSTCDVPVFGRKSDNIIDYKEDKGALILAAGEVTVTAHYTGNENYLPADCNDTKTFTIGVGTPNITWSTAFKKGNYDKGETIVLSATSNYNNNESPIIYEIVSMNPAECATLDNTTNTLTCVAPGKVTVKAYQSAISCKINYKEITKAIQIGQGPHVITWTEESYSYKNTDGTIDLSQLCKCETGSITFTSSDNNIAEVSGNDLTIKQITSEGSVTITASVDGDDAHEAASAQSTFTITIEPLTITVNKGSSSDNPIDLGTSNPQVTSVSENVDFLQLLTNSNAISCNYNNVTYSFASSNNNIAKFNTDNTITANKVATGLQITVTASVTGLTDVSETLYVNIPRGTMVFNRDGNWGDMLTDGSNWHRRDLIPTKVDHNVSIAANCTVNVTTAECYDMEIADNGTLTISTAGILNVADTLLNNDESKLRIEADANGQGTLIFHNKKTMPMATVEMWCKGSETGTGADGGDINPNWQYRGIAVSSATLTENAPGLIYQWSETAQVSEATGITEQWTKVTDNAMSAWNGYAVAKYTDAEGHGYKTSASGELTNADQEIALAYTASQTPEDQTPEGVQSGFNLITNSFTAPIRIKDIVFGDETEEDEVTEWKGVWKGIVLFNTGKYVDWRNSDKEIREGNTGPGQYLFLPKYTAGEIATTELIPSGESFFVVAYQTDKTVQIPYSAVEQQVNGALRMPERREVYGKLIIEVDGGEGADRLYLLENENRIRGFENGYDGPKYAGTKGNPMLYATTDDGRMCVSADSSLLGQYIGFAAGKHDVTYTMTFDASALSGYSELYLYDTREKRYTNILDGGSYTFKGLVGGEDRRFKIVGSREDGKSVTGDDQTIIVTGNRFHVTGYDNADERIYLVDMTGKILWETSTAFGPWFDIPTDIPAGVYVIKTGNHTAKMAVK